MILNFFRRRPKANFYKNINGENANHHRNNLAVVDRNQATVGESIALQVTIDGGKGDVDLSGLTDFKTISRGSSSSFQMINGRTSRQLIHDYVLIPLKAGNLTIPAIPVTLDGKIHYTTPIGVTVSKEPTTDSGQRDVYVTAEVSDPAPWVGQQIIYTFRLFNAVQVADAKFQAPEFNGFNAEELEDRQSHRTVVNGREFIVTEVKFILVPVKKGSLEIQPAVLQVGLLQRNRRPRPFSGMDAFFCCTNASRASSTAGSSAGAWYSASSFLKRALQRCA